MPENNGRTILLAGASRGLGLGLAQEFLARSWHVVATARSPERSAGLTTLRGHNALRVEALDIEEPDSIASLAKRLGEHRFDALFVVVGMSGARDKTPRELTHAEIAREFITNATAPIAVAEHLAPLLTRGAPVAFMTSIMGSIASNAGGGMDLYRSSKAALNMLGVNFALRHKEHAVLLVHPGWVRTDMGGKSAPLDVETSCKGMANLIETLHKPGAHYLDYEGKSLPW